MSFLKNVFPETSSSWPDEISNLCRGRPKPNMRQLRPALPVIAKVLSSDLGRQGRLVLGIMGPGPRCQWSYNH